MKLIIVLQMMLIHFISFPLISLVSGGEGRKNTNRKKEDPTAYCLIPAYLMAALLSFIFVAWASWRIIHDWGSWKIHALSPRPQYLRKAFGWVGQEKLELKQAKLDKRKKATRDKYKFYRTTKADYKWIFHDPTGELQQRFDDQKKQSYLRLLPSWMRSYPHGTLQSGVLVKQGKATKGIYQLPELQSNDNSRHSVSEPLEYADLDYYTMSGVLRDPYRLSDFPIMEHPDSVKPSALGKSCLLSKLPMMDDSTVIQVWRARLTPLPELLGVPRRASTPELNGEVESQQTTIQRDTEYRLRMGRPQWTTNEFGTEASATHVPVQVHMPPPPLPPGWQLHGMLPPPVLPPRWHPDELGRSPGSEALRPVSRRQRQRYYENLLQRHVEEVRADPTSPTLTLDRGTRDNLMQEVHQARGARHRQARITSRPPVQDPPVPENVRRADRLPRYIQDLERRIHDLRSEPTSASVRGTLDNLMQELHQASSARRRQPRIASRPPVQDPPVPENVRRADRLPRYIQDLERRIHDLRTEPTSASVRGTLDSLTQELRGARATRDRLAPLAILPPAVPTSRDELQNNVMWNLATEDFRNQLRNLMSRQVLDIQAFATTMNTFYSLFQGLTMMGANSTPTANMGPAHPVTQRLLGGIQNTNASTPTFVRAQSHREANRAVIEGPGMDGNTSPDPSSEEEVDGRGDRAVTEGPEPEDTYWSNPSSEEESRPDTQHPIAAALLRSVPDNDTTLDQAGPAARRHPVSEETVRAEATRQTAAFYTEMGRSDPSPDIHVQDFQTENNATLINPLHSPSSSTAPLPSPTASATQATTTATPISPDLEDALNEELYTDAYP
ncbi:MAG: hypothetical protein Q9161_002138 [Pseudevernia consocians]